MIMDSELSEIQKVILNSLSSSSKVNAATLRMLARKLDLQDYVAFNGPLLVISHSLIEAANNTNKLDQLIREIYVITDDIELVNKWREWQNKFTKKNSGGGAYIGGNVTTSGTYNNTNIQIGGDVSSSIIIAGDGNIVGNRNITQSTHEELIKLIKEIKKKLEAINVSSDELQELKEDVTKIEKQLEKPRPNKTIVLERLKSASEFIKSVSGATPTLIDLVQKALTIAQKYFL